MGLGSIVACSSDKPNQGGEEQRAGKLTLPLRTVSNTGSVYFLRNAFFQIFNENTGEVTFVSTEDSPQDQSELVVRLASGPYDITLFDGWFLERFGGDGGTGGIGGIGGIGGGSTGGMTGTGGTTGSAGKGPIPVPGGGLGPVIDDIGEAGASSASGGAAPGTGGSVGTGGSIAVGGESPVGGSFGTGGTGTNPGGGEIVTNARLVSDPTQFFFISPQGDSFVTYSFRVGDDVIEFNRGNLHIGIDVDDQPLCQPPEDVTHVERVLIETNGQAVSGVSLAAVFKALASNGGHGGDPSRLYQEIFDSYATADQGTLPDAIHCGDETTDGDTTLNGYHLDCNRAERAHVSDMDAFFATAFVNRMDLAPANGAHCGQQRMIFANNKGPGSFGFGRTFMILEAQIPNPSPELGIEGCRPLAQFWLDQDSIGDPLVRGQRLQQAFLFGDVPGLEQFPAFYTAENLTIGSGQIRTNQFDDNPWTLREFKLALNDNGGLTAVPFPVAEAPHGALWDETSGLSQGEACRESFLSALDGVLTDDRSLMSFVVDSACKDAESRNDFNQDYASRLQGSPLFRQQIENKLLSLGSKLSPEDIANRARFSGSCIGCHQEAQGSSLGNGLFAPATPDFPMVLEFQESCGDGGGSCFATSPALKTVFLPGRLLALGKLVPVVPNPCVGGGGGTGGSGGFGGDSGTAGTFAMGGSVSTGGKGGGGMPLPDPAAAPVIEIQLPSADEPVEILQEVEQEIRDEYGDVTISGKSAQSTH
jgi:hypothetical protein